MRSLWNAAEAAAFQRELGQRVYTSRLVGRESALVLHGGGNTSVKVVGKNLVGDEETILWVKGSGGDLARIDESGFSPVRLDHLLRLARLSRLSDPEMVNELRTHMTRASAPTQSVEAILHAVLPFRYVDHTHADAVIAVCNAPGGEARVREIWGDEAGVVPYVMPGFDLARLCAERFAAESGPNTIGMVLLNHGIFSFGDTAREDTAVVHLLLARGDNREVLLSTWEQQDPLQVIIAQGQSLPGLVEGLLGARVGGTRLLVLPPDLAFGPDGDPTTSASPPALREVPRKHFTNDDILTLVNGGFRRGDNPGGHSD